MSSPAPSNGEGSSSSGTSFSALPPKCVVCLKDAHYMCSLCGPGYHYCSSECQTADWKSHKLVCRGVKRKNQSETEPPPDPESARVSMELSVSQQSSTHGVTSLERRVGKKVVGRGNIAQVINSHPSHGDIPMDVLNNSSSQDIDNQPPSPTMTSNTAAEQIEDMIFYTNQVYMIIKPVVACIILAMFWVKITRVSNDYYDTGNEAPSSSSYIDNLTGSSGSDTSAAVLASLKTAGIYLAQIIGATFVIVALFKYGCMKILYAIFGVIVLGLLGLFGYLLGSSLLIVYNVPFDWITFGFCLWNLVVAGLAMIFWKGPLYLQQIYLVLMSSMMAYSLTTPQTPALTTWILLVLLAIWDLIAVLCPFGPLRVLIETAKKEDREIPALLYSVMVWMMASPPETLPSERRPSPIQPPQAVLHSVDDTRFLANPSPKSKFSLSEYDEDRELTSLPVTDRSERRTSPLPAGTAPSQAPRHGEVVVEEGAEPENQDEDEEDDEKNGLKLGLGDFVFYSVLIGRAALFDWITTIACMVAVLTGLNTTIFLLVIYRRALPALPISIAFGVLFYFVSSIVLTPFMIDLVQLSPPPSISLSSALIVGKGMNGGMIYV